MNKERFLLHRKHFIDTLLLLCNMVLKISLADYQDKVLFLNQRTGEWKSKDDIILSSPAVRCLSPNHFSCRLQDGSEHTVLVEYFDEESRVFVLRINGRRVRIQMHDDLDEVAERTGARKATMRKTQALRSPMPGLVVNVWAQSGAPVRKGDVLLVLEAMKMENAIKAPADAIVAEVLCEPGQSVEKGSVLVRFRE